MSRQSPAPTWHPAFPPSAARTLARFFADSIDRLNDARHPRWGLTPFSSGVVRLNAGYCECLTSDANDLEVLAVADLLPTGVRRPGVKVLRGRGPFYEPVPNSICVSIDIGAVKGLGDLLHSLQAAHFAFLDKAVRSALGGGIKKGHRNYAVAAIAAAAERKVSSPLWARARIEPGPEQDKEFWEGAEKRSVLTSRERSRDARLACVAHFGPQCVACGFSFERKYGAHGRGYVEVHHIAPLGKAVRRRRVDPIRDLRPVCSNCHRMIHRNKVPLTIRQLQALLRK